VSAAPGLEDQLRGAAGSIGLNVAKACRVSSGTDGGATVAFLLLTAIGSGRRKKPRAKRAMPVREL
jgi:hypothetical protein